MGLFVYGFETLENNTVLTFFYDTKKEERGGINIINK